MSNLGYLNITADINGSMSGNNSAGEDEVVAGLARPFWFLFCKIFLNIMGMLGNSTVIIIYSKKKDFRPSECFILSIASVDFCFSFLSLLLWILGFFSANTETINSMLITFVIYYSLYLIFWVSFNRYIAVIKPIDYMQIFSSRTVFSIIATGFLFGVVFAMIPVLYYNTKSELYHKILDAIYYSSKVFFILVDIIFMCVVYSNVASLESRKAAKKNAKNYNGAVAGVEPQSNAFGGVGTNAEIGNCVFKNGVNFVGGAGTMHAEQGPCKDHPVVLEESSSLFNAADSPAADKIDVLPSAHSPTLKFPWKKETKQNRRLLKLSRRATTEGNVRGTNAKVSVSTPEDRFQGIEMDQKNSKLNTEVGVSKLEAQQKNRQLSVDMTVLDSEVSPRRKPRVALLKKALTGIELHPGGTHGRASSGENSALTAPMNMNSMLKPRTSLRQKRVTFTLFFVCSIFIAVTLPFTLVEILSYAPPIFNAKPIVVYELKLVTYLVYCINFVVNPFIYFFGNTFYRKELFELINNSFFCGKCKILLPNASNA